MSVMSCISGLQSMSLGGSGFHSGHDARRRSLRGTETMHPRRGGLDPEDRRHRGPARHDAQTRRPHFGSRYAVSMGPAAWSRRWVASMASSELVVRRNTHASPAACTSLHEPGRPYPPLPLDILELLTSGLVERVCDGRLEEGRAAEIAVRRAWILLECGVSLP